MPIYQTRWLQDVISREYLGNFTPNDFKLNPGRSGSMCLLCKGGRMLCGKLSCPVVARAQSLARSSLKITSTRIEGSTPPGVFVGRIGYPKVYIGPMVPPFKGDTTILDTPELWVGKDIKEIVDYRFSLIRGMAKASVHDAREGGRLIDSMQELAMGKQPVDAEVNLDRLPSKTITLGSEIQPFGPSAPMKSFSSSDVNTNPKIENAYYDRDLKAADAVLDLYHDGVLVTQIQRSFSLGMFGTGDRRRLVPTRWSITAVDSIISQELVDRIKQFDTIDEYRVYYFEQLDNRFVAILAPEKWSFEWIEAWFPGTTWNPDRWATAPAMLADWEPYQGRTTYPEVGGCYFSSRLAVAEKLEEEKRQASALVLREIRPGYILPVGVWLTRESVRALLAKEPVKFTSFQKALEYLSNALSVPIKKWISVSRILKDKLTQRKLLDFT
ncbi:MAG: Nre family DNA repair protein [Candidatus Hadarchaeota archaeon]